MQRFGENHPIESQPFISIDGHQVAGRNLTASSTWTSLRLEAMNLSGKIYTFFVGCFGNFMEFPTWSRHTDSPQASGPSLNLEATYSPEEPTWQWKSNKNDDVPAIQPCLHSQKLTWNPKNAGWEDDFPLIKGWIFRCHVSFQEGSFWYLEDHPW